MPLTLLRPFGPMIGLIALSCGAIASAQEAENSAAPKPVQSATATVPAGAEKAVAAALRAYPGAKLVDVATLSQAFGIGGGHDSFFTVHVDVGGVRATVNAGSEGVLIHASRPVETKDLPTMVATGMARVAPKGAAKITKRETFGVIRFVAIKTPDVRFTARVSGGDGSFDVTVAPDGALLGRKEAKGARKTPQRDPNARTSDGPIPEPAARAVAAMREAFPGMVFDQVEEVPYLDSSTQTMEMLWYEVEFFVDGVKHEFNATPDGIVIDYHRSIASSDLPAPARAAIEKAADRSRVEEITKSETRAEPRIVALESPVVVYEIEPVVESGVKRSAIKLRVDGTEVKAPELPDWARTPEEKEGRDSNDGQGTKRRP